MKVAHIYKITNLANNKVHIGLTRRSIKRRFYEHKWDAKMLGKNIPIHNAIRKYGEENFVISVLERCTIDVAEEKEIYYIARHKSQKDGYNITRGGDGGATRKLGPLTKEHKEKIAKKHRGKPKYELRDNKSHCFKVWSYFDADGNYHLCDTISKTRWCKEHGIGRDLIKDNIKRLKPVAKGRFAGYKFFNYGYYR